MKSTLFKTLLFLMIISISCKKEAGNTTNTTVVSPPVNDKATVQTDTITSLSYTSALSGGNVTSEGSWAVTNKGICYSTSPNPTLSDSFTTDGLSIGTFVSHLNNLTANTVYYVRAYAINAAGTSFGQQLSFTTLAYGAPLVQTDPASFIDFKSAQLYGSYLQTGLPPSNYGFCIDTMPNPSLSTAMWTIPGFTSGSGFYYNLSGLLPLTTYHVRAFAVNTVGTGYGNDEVFTTTAYPNTIVGGNGITYYVQRSDIATSMEWCESAFFAIIPGVLDTVDGEANTSAIINYVGSNAGYSYAAKLCEQSGADGFTDWYLPSKSELRLIYQNKNQLTGTFYSAYYWSSSQYDADKAYSFAWNSGLATVYYKNLTQGVRCIRK